MPASVKKRGVSRPLFLPGAQHVACVASRCHRRRPDGGCPVPACCGLEPDDGRLAPVERPEPRRPIGGERASESVARRWSAARVACHRRGRGIFLVCRGERQALHARRPRRNRIRDGVRRREREAALGNGERTQLRQRSWQRSAGDADGRGQPDLRLRRQRRPERPRRGVGKGPVEDQRVEQIRRLQHQLGAERVAARAERSHPRQRRRSDRGAVEDGRLPDLEERRSGSGRLLVGRPARSRRHPSGDLLHAHPRRGR